MDDIPRVGRRSQASASIINGYKRETPDWEKNLHEALNRKLQKGETQDSLFPPRMLYGPGWIGTRPPTPRARRSNSPEKGRRGRSREVTEERSRQRNESRSISPPAPDLRTGRRQATLIEYNWKKQPEKPRLVDANKRPRSPFKQFAFGYDESEYWDIHDEHWPLYRARTTSPLEKRSDETCIMHLTDVAAESIRRIQTAVGRQRKDMNANSESQVSMNIFAEQIGNRLKNHALTLSRAASHSNIRRAAAAARLTAIASRSAQRDRRPSEAFAEHAEAKLLRGISEGSDDVSDKRKARRSSVGTQQQASGHHGHGGGLEAKIMARLREQGHHHDHLEPPPAVDELASATEGVGNLLLGAKEALQEGDDAETGRAARGRRRRKSVLLLEEEDTGEGEGGDDFQRAASSRSRGRGGGREEGARRPSVVLVEGSPDLAELQAYMQQLEEHGGAGGAGKGGEGGQSTGEERGGGSGGRGGSAGWAGGRERGGGGKRGSVKGRGARSASKKELLPKGKLSRNASSLTLSRNPSSRAITRGPTSRDLRHDLPAIAHQKRPRASEDRKALPDVSALRNGRQAAKKTLEDLGPDPVKQFKIGRIIGVCPFSSIVVALHTKKQKHVALQVFNKTHVIDSRSVGIVMRERNILNSISHPNCIAILSSFQTEAYLFMVMELAHGGEVFSYLQREGKFQYTTARFFTAQIVLGLEYLHSQSIVHRDVKPENMVLDTRGNLKLATFSFAKIVQDKTWTFCGTPEYMAPEVIKGDGYGFPVDWWGLGVVVHEFLAGFPPFQHDDRQRLYDMILRGEYDMPLETEATGRRLVKQLLVADWTKRLGCTRLGANQVKSHNFFKGVDWDKLLSLKVPPIYKPPVADDSDVSQFQDYKTGPGIPDIGLEEALHNPPRRGADGAEPMDDIFAGF